MGLRFIIASDWICRDNRLTSSQIMKRVFTKVPDFAQKAILAGGTGILAFDFRILQQGLNANHSSARGFQSQPQPARLM